MPKPTVIDTPYPTLDEVARTYGISASRRRQLERQVQELLTRGVADVGRSRGRSATRAGRNARKK